jgi:shikimate 5-dehydrogenase
MIQVLRPVALIGPEANDVVLRLYKLEQRFLPLVVPAESKLNEVLAGLAPLGFLGAVLFGKSAAEALPLVVRKTRAAERDGLVDALAVHGQTQHGTSTLEEALLGALGVAGFRGLGGRAVIVGGGPWAAAATQVVRLGLRTLTIAAANRPASERLAQQVPAGVQVHALSLDDERLAAAISAADLVLHCAAGASIDPRLLSPAHTLVEAYGETSLAVAVERVGGQVVPHRLVAQQRLAAQLHHVTGLKIDLTGLI